MVAAIDLTQRQAARVLEQAVRAGSRVEIEPRSRDESIHGCLAGRDNDLLRVDLHDHGRDWSLTGLTGAFCDVKTVLSGQLYLFSSCIVDAIDNTVPQRLLLAVPDIVQVANRRKFDRSIPQERIPVQLWPGQSDQPATGTLSNLGPAGLGCRVPRRDLEDLLLIDDQVRVRFQLYAASEFFDLAAVVCVKTPTGDGEQLDVGLEFCVPQPNATAQPGLDRLHAAIAQNYSGPAKTEGDP